MLLLTMLLATSAVPEAETDPLRPARTGQVQCYLPDSVRKTCRSLAAYSPSADGGYDNRAMVLLSPDGPATITTSTPVRITADAVCGTTTIDDIRGATLAVGATTVPADRAAPILATVAAGMRDLIGHEICTRYVPEGAGLVAKVSIDGRYQPVMDQQVIWVAASDGYRVAP